MDNHSPDWLCGNHWWTWGRSLGWDQSRPTRAHMHNAWSETFGPSVASSPS